MAPRKLQDTLTDLIAEFGVAAVLLALAHVMAGRGSVAGGIVSEVAAIERRLATQHPAGENGNDNIPGPPSDAA